jgi:hypothetical protein
MSAAPLNRSAAAFFRSSASTPAIASPSERRGMGKAAGRGMGTRSSARIFGRFAADTHIVKLTN